MLIFPFEKLMGVFIYDVCLIFNEWNSKKRENKVNIFDEKEKILSHVNSSWVLNMSCMSRKINRLAERMVEPQDSAIFSKS